MSSLDGTIQLLTVYKYILLFPVSVVEGPIVSVLGGFLSAKGILNIYLTYFILILGDLVGDTMYYSIGRWGGRRFIRKWGNFFGIKEDKVLKTEEHFKNHGGKTLVLGKTQAIGAVFLAAAGLSKMPYLRFLKYNLFTTIFKSLILLLTGYYFGHAYRLINQYFGIYAAVTSAVLMLGVVVYLILRPKRNK